MKNRYLTSENIDQIGTKVLKAVRVQDRDIDRILGVDGLFDPVRAAIGTGQKRASTTITHVLAGFGTRNWALTAASLALIVGVSVVGIGLILRGAGGVTTESVEQVPVEGLDLPPLDIPKQIEVASTVQKSRSVAKRHFVTHRLTPETEQLGEFQTVTDTGDNDDAGSRILRVELPRSSLFALGVDVPVENQSTNKVKADLLIGEDGVMRAVRIVE